MITPDEIENLNMYQNYYIYIFYRAIDLRPDTNFSPGLRLGFMELRKVSYTEHHPI